VKKYTYFWFLAAVLIVLFSSCNKRIVPEKIAGSDIKTFDEDAFNYYYVEGIKQKLSGNPADALKYFEECIKLNPKSDGSFYQIAQILVAAGDNTRAKDYLKSAINIDGNNGWYLLMLSGLYYQEQNLDSAIVYYEMLVNVDKDSESNLLTLGNLYSEDKRYEEAQKVYERFDEKYGVNENSTTSEIKNLMDLKRYDEAENKTRELIKTDPNNISYNGILADLYRIKNENEKALEVYKELIERNPDNGEIQLSLCDFLVSGQKYDELFELLPAVIINTGVPRDQKIAFMAKLIDDKEVTVTYREEMIMALMVLEANYKDDNIIPLMRPEFLMNSGRDAEAAARLEEMIKANPDNYYAWEKLLLVYLQMGDFKSLYARAGECATKFNMSYIAKLLYANGAIEMGKYDIAAEELRKADILAGSDNDMKLQVITMRADMYYRQKLYDKAFAEFDDALVLNKEDLTLLNNYAYFLAEQNQRLKEAEEMISKVIEKEGDNPTFLDTYAWVLYKRGKYKEASRIMEKITGEGQKQDAELLEHYGYILMKLRKCNEAVIKWNQALSIDNSKQYLLKEIENCTK
jgi:tetratricopeptide (TPR) repeat protein